MDQTFNILIHHEDTECFSLRSSCLGNRFYIALPPASMQSFVVSKGFLVV